MMKRRCFRNPLLWALCFVAVHLWACESAVTFIPNGGRLGDNLINLWRAKYFAYRHNMRFFLPLFAYADKLMVAYVEKHYTPALDQQFERIVRINNEGDETFDTSKRILYKVNFYFKSCKGLGTRDPVFMDHMKKLLYPRYPVKVIAKAPHRINVAIHLRHGSNKDSVFARNQKIWPTKFPPFSYYVNALRKVYEMFGSQPLHVHVFTDAERSEKIMVLLKFAFRNARITFSCRQNNKDAHKLHVLEDLFNMATFDCLIRSSSGLARIAQLIGNHVVTIMPKQPVWHDEKLSIEKLGIIDKRIIKPKKRVSSKNT